jgi:hypothetical protein
MNRRRARSTGYSLLELVLAVAIFSMGVVAVLELFATCLHASSVSLAYTQAVYLAQGLMEDELAEGVFDDRSDSGDFGENYPLHSWSYDVEETEKLGLYKFHVVVNWKERGVTKEFELSTLVADRK